MKGAGQLNRFFPAVGLGRLIASIFEYLGECSGYGTLVIDHENLVYFVQHDSLPVVA
jgi:hypothetical protein